jgi:hypothetical protein
MTLRPILLALCALATACAADGVSADQARPLPAFPAFKPRPAGEDRILTLALAAGYLAWQGRCLGFSGSGGEFTTIIWPETARLGRDRVGIFITDSRSGTRIRLGDYFRSGGGRLPAGAAERIAAELTEPVPPECAASVIAVNPGFKKARPPR